MPPWLADYNAMSAMQLGCPTMQPTISNTTYSNGTVAGQFMFQPAVNSSGPISGDMLNYTCHIYDGDDLVGTVPLEDCEPDVDVTFNFSDALPAGTSKQYKLHVQAVATVGDVEVCVSTFNVEGPVSLACSQSRLSGAIPGQQSTYNHCSIKLTIN